MSTVKRMPPLTMDEVILLADTYFSLKNISTLSMRWDMIKELSDTMQALPFFPELRANSAFRSSDGMNMCLSRISGLDHSSTTSLGKASMRMERIFNYYSLKQNTLHAVASAIRNLSRCKFPLLKAYEDNIMGQMIPSYCVYREQTDKIVLNGKKMVLSRGITTCAVCGIDLEVIYPGHHADLLEPHVTLEIKEINGKEKLTLSDILFLCPSCHKLAHTAPDMLEINNLRKQVKGRQN